MFGGNNNSNNQLLPVLLDENRLQYQTNAPNSQLQLFGNMAAGCTIDPANCFGSDHKTSIPRPNKRGRESEDLSRQQQKLQISLHYNLCQGKVDRSASIHNQNPVSTGLKLSYDDDERNSSVSSASGSMTGGTPILLLGENLRTELDRQKEEFDQYIKVQEEHLARGVRDLKQRHMTSLLTTLEKGIKNKLHQKELELENMNHKNKELAERIKHVAAEAQNWHYRAKYNESVVNVLKNNLQQALSQGADHGKEGFGDSEVDDAASYKDHHGHGKAAALTTSGLNEHLICKSCRSREVKVLLMPCRHLCLCKDCDGLVRVCPMCGGIKTASVEVYLS